MQTCQNIINKTNTFWLKENNYFDTIDQVNHLSLCVCKTDQILMHLSIKLEFPNQWKKGTSKLSHYEPQSKIQAIIIPFILSSIHIMKTLRKSR